MQARPGRLRAHLVGERIGAEAITQSVEGVVVHELARRGTREIPSDVFRAQAQAHCRTWFRASADSAEFPEQAEVNVDTQISEFEEEVFANCVRAAERATLEAHGFLEASLR